MSEDSNRFVVLGPGSLADTRREVERVLIPQAKELGLMKAHETAADVLTWKRLGTSQHSVDSEALHGAPPKEFISVMFEAVVISTAFAAASYKSDPDGEWASILTEVQAILPYVNGYMDALLTTRAANVKRGANGRRLIGASSRERVRREAEPLRGKKSKEQAAALIADVVRLSPSRVRKLLSEIHPGDTWTAISTDSSTRDDG